MSRREELRLIAKVATLYYGDNLKQTEIAQRLDLSQAGVSRLLKRAIDEKIVRISVNTPSGYYPDVENQIRDKYNLKEVIVVDSADNRDQLLRNLGAGAAYYLENTLKANDLIGISSWSEALLATANTMQRLGSSISVNVIQILGGLGNPTSESHAAQLTRRLAELVNGEAIMLPAPGIVGTSDTRTILLQDPYLQNVLQQFDDVTLALVGIGTVEPSLVLANSGNAFPGDELDLLRTANAVGDVCLRFFDVDGKPVETPLNERVIGMSLQEMKQVKRSIGVAGGERKHVAIRAAIRGGWINILVTDYETAKFLVEQG